MTIIEKIKEFLGMNTEKGRLPSEFIQNPIPTVFNTQIEFNGRTMTIEELSYFSYGLALEKAYRDMMATKTRNFTKFRKKYLEAEQEINGIIKDVERQMEDIENQMETIREGYENE